MTTQFEQENGLTLQELVGILWGGKWIIASVTFIAALLALAYLWIATPIYRVDAMIQVEEKKGGAGAMFGELGDMFNVASPAETEIEIIKSRMVLGKVVEDLKLDIVAAPKVTPIIGKAMLRRDPNAPKISIERFDVPETMKGEGFQILTQNNQTFALKFKEDVILQGKVGEVAQGVFTGDTIRIFVSNLRANAGQVFNLTRIPFLKAIDNLNSELSAMEKGKKTGILALSLQGPDVKLTTDILNAVAQGYVQQNVDRKSAEAEKTLTFIRSQLPELKQRADSTENRLNTYRLQVGSIDLEAESKLILDQGVDLESKMLVLKQQKAELLRLYKEDHPNVQTLEAQIQQLQNGMGNVSDQVRRLPKTQQEILRLAQEAKVAAEVYNTMLNNAQQLEVAKAGQVGNVRVIDSAMPSYLPVKPKKSSTFVLICLLGAFAGAGLVLLRRLWGSGIKDPKILESKFGMPVFATIPHSNFQRRVSEARKRRDAGIQVLCVRNQDEMAVEAFRSLRTTLHFSMHDSRNNVLLLTGASPNIGKSFVSTNLAVVLANAGKRVCLIDADMRRGNIHDDFGLSRDTGLSDYLAGKASFDEVQKPTAIENLTVITTGLIPPNASELLLGSRTEKLFEGLSGRYDYVLIDSPPILAVADAMVIAEYAGTTLLVLKHGQHPVQEVELTLQRLGHSGIKAKGAIFNDVSVAGSRGGYGYGYTYQYKYGKK